MKYTTLALLLCCMISLPSKANFPLNENECDKVIKNTFYNTSARNNATVYNAQVCLNKAGYFSNAGGFTVNYGAVTKSAAQAYIDNQNNTNVVQAQSPEPAASQIATSLPSSNDSANNTVNSLSAASPSTVANSAESPISKPAPLTPPPAPIIDQVATAVTDQGLMSNNRQPQVLDKLLVNSVYFIFALPFMLFGLSIVMAFARSTKK
jgi:hypothetical protein